MLDKPTTVRDKETKNITTRNTKFEYIAMTNAHQHNEDSNLLTFQERKHLAKTLPKDEKQQMVIKTYFSNTMHHMRDQGKCLDCSFLNENCICQSLENLSTINNDNATATTKSPSIRFLVWMHYKEKYRASNTGKLLLKLFPGSKYFIHALPEDSMEFSNIVTQNASANDTITVVLYPSSDAIDAKDLLKEQTTGPLASYKPISQYNHIDIVILDGTWKQARKLRRNCTSLNLLHVKISPTELSKFCCRRQSRIDHISTVEAAATFLSTLGLFDSNVIASMYTGLELLCDAMDKQSHIYTMPYVKPTKNGIHRIPKHAHWDTS